MAFITKKKLYVGGNAPEEAVFLSPNRLTNLLTEKVFGHKRKNFRPTQFKEHHFKLFISNVDPVMTPIRSGKQLNSFEEARNYLHTLGNEIYGTNEAGKLWPLRLIMNEIIYGNEKAYAIDAASQEGVERIKKNLSDYADVIVNEIVEDQNNQIERKEEHE